MISKLIALKFVKNSENMAIKMPKLRINELFRVGQGYYKTSHVWLPSVPCSAKYAWIPRLLNDAFDL
jgi:hypothetical protein